MRVLIASPWLDAGGLERYATEVGAQLAASGHEVTRVAHAPERVDDTRRGVRTIAFPPALKLSNAPVDPRMGRLLRRLLRAEEFDVVNAHTPVPGVAEQAFTAARRARVPFVVTYHAGALLSRSPILALPARLHAATFERAMLAGADARLAVSPFVAERVFAGMPSALAPPGVDVARYRPGGRPVEGRVLFVGPVSRAYSWKGISTLFDALRILPRATLRVVGAGDLVEHYKARAEREGIASRASFVGRLDEDALVEEYQSASVVALPSVTAAESFGMVLAEANACARPVVGTRAGGIPGFVRHGENGFLVEPGDADDLADALDALLSNPGRARAMGERGRKLVETRHRWREAAEALLREASQVSAPITGASSRATRRSGA